MALLKTNTGIGTTNPTSALHVIGDGFFTGVVTAASFSGPINAGVGTFTNLTAINATLTNINSSGISTLGVTSVTRLTAQSINSSGIVTGSTFRPSTGYIQAADGTNSFYIYNSTGNVAFQGTIGASQVNNAQGYKVIGFAGTNNATFENNVYISGITTSVGGFVGNLTGTATTATKLETARTFEITGDVVATAISFDGTGNVSLAATIQPNSVGLGTDTTGDYVRDITGTANEIEVTGGTGEGSTPQIGLPDDVVITNNLYVGGITTSVGGFVGSLTGIAASATKLVTPRTFEITGDVVATAISFDGTGNVSLAATIQPNSVGLGTDTFGDYVRDITGTSNEIVVTGGTGEGSTPVVSFAPNPTIGGNVTIGNDLQVNNNLNVNGNITVGGTTAYVIVEDFRLTDADIVLGFTTDSYGNDASTDTTANHGGIAVASTEGYPLVQLINVAIGESLPATYKKFMWFQAGSFAGLNTDAWLSNYAIGIGSTQFPSGTRLAAGSVQFTEDDLAVVRNINASGIITAASFSGNAATASYADVAGIATYATLAGIATYADVAGIATYADVAGIATYATSAGIATYATSAGIASYADVAGIATYATSAGVSTDVIGGIASVTELNVSGVTTVGFITATNAYVAGVVTATTFVGSFTGIASTATQLLTPRDFSITGDFVTASAISFDGTGNVALAATITPNSIELGTYTSGNYVASITNGDYITGGDGGTEGAALTIGVAATSANTANQVVARDESGNFSAGTITANLTGTATTASFATTSYYLTDAENILDGTINPARLTGTYDIDINGNATTADYADVAGIATYATSAGIASYADVTGIATYATSAGIASYADVAGISTYADVAGISTYATLAGIASYADVAGIATYAILSGISSYAGISTYSSLAGIASYADVAGIATYAISAGIASYADVAGISTYSSLAGIASYADVAGIATYAILSGISSYADVTGIATYATSAGIASYADVTGISTYATLAGIASYADVAGISTNVIGGIASVTQLNVSGVSTISVNSSSDALRITQLGSGNALVVEDETNPDASPFVVTGIGSIGIGTTNPQYKTHIVDTAATGAGLLVQGGGGGSPIARFERTVGVTGALVDVNASGGDPQIRFHRVGITTFAIGLNQSTGTGDVFEIASSGALGTNTRFVIDSSNGNVGIGTTNPTSKLQVQGDVSVSGVVTAVGGFNIGIQSGGVSVTTGVITALNFVGTGNTFNYNSSTKTIDISISSGVTTSFSRTVNQFTATEGQTSFSVTYTVGYIDVYVNGVYLDPSEYTATDETSVVLDDPANAGDSVIIITYVTGGILVSGVSDRTKTLVIAGAGQTQFNVNYISNNYLDVYLNGSKLNNNEYSANDGTTVGLTTGASLNDELEFVTYNPVYTEAVWSATSPGSGQNGSIYRSSGNVGIGTTVPTAKLHVVGDGKIVGILTASQFVGDGSLLTGIIAQGSGVQIKDDGTLVGTAATFNFINNINATVSSGVAEISISYVDNAGVSTDVIGGIGSITQLNVSGITTTVTLNVLDNSSSDALRITQEGSGNALVVEDETNPDATPFVVTGIGSVGIGTTNPISKLHVTSEDSEVIRIERTNDNNALIQYTNIVGSMYAGLSPSATGWGVDSDNNLSANPHLLVLRGGGEVLVGSGTSTGTASQKLQVTGGAYVSGFVGIGTTNPTAPLHISGADAANAKIKLEDNDNGFAASEINVANGGRDLRIAAPQDIYFEDLDTNTKTLYIKDGGNVGIGTDDPGAKLNVVDNSSSDALRITQEGSGNALVVEDSTNPDATPFVVRADGKVGVGTTGLIQYSSGVNDTSTFGILAPTGNAGAFILKGNNGSATDGSGQTLAILVGSTGGDGSGSLISHLSHDTSGIGTRRNAIRFTDNQIRFEDNVSGSVDVTINSSGSGELLVGRTSSTGTSNQLLQVQGGAYVSGNVGIGTTNPLTTLDARGKTLLWNQSNVGYAATKGDMDTYAVLKLRGHATDSTNMQFAHLNNGNAMGVQVTNSSNTANWDILLNPFGGAVGIGTTNPTSTLHVVGNTFVTGIITSTDYNSTSDIKLKTNISTISNPLDKIVQLNGVEFTWKETGKKSAGVIAQEVEKVLPNLVSGDETKTVNYNGLIGLLIECIKDQQKEIDFLKQKILP